MILSRTNKCRFLLSIGTVCISLLISSPLSAHGDATGVVKERMELMKSLGKKMKTIAAMVKGKDSFDAGQVRLHASTIGQKAPQIKVLFPSGSLHEPTEALPVIWQNWDQFSLLTSRLENEANSLQLAVNVADQQATRRQFVRLGKVCSSCHSKFRKKKKE